MKKTTALTWLFIVSAVLYVILTLILSTLVVVLINADPEDRDNIGQENYEVHSGGSI